MPEQPQRPILLAIGGAHIDRRGQIFDDYIPAASNPGRMVEDIGGVALNALRTAIQRDVDGALISIRGGDSAGDKIVQAIEIAGIADNSAVFLDRSTASYTALIDCDGELIVGFADMEIYNLFARQLRRKACREAIERSDAILCDTNMPAEAIEILARETQGRPLYAIGISPAKVVRLRNTMIALACLFINRKEATALLETGADTQPIVLVESLRAAGLASAVITDGGKPLTFFDNVHIWQLEPPALHRIADVTGAGDAMAGATIAALMHKTDMTEAVRQGIAAATLTLETERAVAAFDDTAFSAALRQVPAAILLE